jgi:4'-phosphopantetheinyl transferase
MIPDNEIHVWYASTETLGKEFGDHFSLLSVEEQQRARSFRFQRDRAAYVLGKCMIRTLLGGMLNVPLRTIRFTHSEYGKPRIVPECELAFNLAHSGTHIACALAADREVGVGIESERDDIEIMALARRYFCRNEIRQLEESPARRKRLLFYKYWTLKEAYLKAEGYGLNISLTAIDASEISDHTREGPDAPLEDIPRGILVQRLEAPPGYAAALAAKGGPWLTKMHRWVDEKCSR